MLAPTATKVIVHDAATLRRRGEIVRAGVRAIAFTPDGSACALGGARSGKIGLFATSDWRLLREIQSPLDSIADLEFDGRAVRLAAAGGGGLVVIDLESGRSDCLTEAAATHVTHSPDGRWIAARADGLRVWSAESLTQAAEFRESGYDPTFSPDGTRLVASSYGGVVFIDAARWRVALRARHEGIRAVKQLAFTKDGNTLLIGDDGGDVAVWRTEGVSLGR